MKLLDIHSHILPEVDDGSANVEESIKLLEMMKAQGITDVIATPHFDASQCSIEEFNSQIEYSKRILDNACYGTDLPKVHIGCEAYFFPGISKSSGIRQLCLGNSKFILLELCYNQEISDRVLNEIMDISNKFGLIPVIAHIERYYRERGFRKLLELIKHDFCLAQVNTMSLMDNQPYKRKALKLLKKGFVAFLATDAHSVKMRPPLMDKALEVIRKKIGDECADNLIENSQELLEQI